MPEMDGFEFVSALRERPEGKSIPIVIITAQAAMARAIQNAEPEIVVLSKPLDIDRLFQVVRNYVG